MKRFSLLLLCLLLVGATLSFAGTKTNGATLVSSSDNEVIIDFKIRNYDYKVVKTSKGKALELIVPKAGRVMQKGAPELPKLSSSLLIPDKAEMSLEILDARYVDVPDVMIAPSKGNLLRNVDPASVAYTFGEAYSKNEFFPGGKLARLRKPFISRDFRGQTVVVKPVQYNPVTKVLRVYKKIRVRVYNSGVSSTNAMVRSMSLKNVDPQFDKFYSSRFINYSTVQSRYTPLPDDIGNMLIVSYSSFMSDMADFVSWKQSLGYNVDLVDYSTIGSSTALKTYVSNYYNANGLTYLLLVGDAAQVPTSSTSAGDSDQNYGYIVGSDHMLDIFVGRFSAETSAHVTTQVDRTVNYERDVLSSETWFNHAIGMGSSEGPGHDSEYDYVHINNILSDLQGYGYTTHECHQSGGSATLMSSLINAGAGTIFYCGHGSVTSWYTSSWQYYSSHVDALVNDNELPFIFSVACVVGDFDGNTCFCETWQLATNNGVPTGSIAHAGSTINQSWIPPMDAQDEFADILVAGSKRTFAGVLACGLGKMIDNNGGDGEDMADTWTVFGDPSVQLRTPGTPNGPDPSGNIAPNANFTWSDNLLTVNFTDTSSDSDGSIVSWSWDFGDGNTSTAQNPVHTFAANGAYSVALTVTDDGGASKTKTQTVAVSDGTTPEVFVDDITVSVASAPGRRYTATAVITIKDTMSNLVSGATVYATWSGAHSGTVSGVTGADGKVSFVTPRIRNAGPYTITVTNVTHATMNYNAGFNNETSDSGSY